MQTTPFDESEIKHSCSTFHESIARCTNNFFLYFALDKSTGKSYYVKLTESLDAMDVTYRSRYPDDENASDKMMDQTMREFLEEINRTATEVCGSLENVREIVRAWCEDKTNEILAKKCFETLTAIYARLRQSGYSRGDLIR